jgi:hypothetical protein
VTRRESGEVVGATGPYGGRQAAALEPYRGQWVALSEPTVVLVAANSPEEVLAWLDQHQQRASFGMFRVPESADEPLGDNLEQVDVVRDRREREV